MTARLAMRTYDCRSRTPRFLASRVSPLIAACKSFASVGKVMSLGCTVVSTVTSAKSYAFVGQSVNMLEQKKPDHKLCRNSRPDTLAVQRRDLAVDELPVDLARELH